LAASLGGAQPTFWWQDVLAGDAPLADAMIHAKDDQLDLLPLDPHAPRESLRSDMRESRLPLSATAGALRHAYDLALVDLGTFFDPISQPTLLTIVEHMRIDVAVAVTGPDRHDPRDLESIAEHLDQTNCELLGTIDNRVT
jgi:MinD-like ATPase involved in chromosome partitioning or flagellar assembly